MRALLLTTLALAGCYNPDLSRVRYTCDPANPFCPDGQKCVSGICGGTETTPTTDAGTPAADMSTPAAKPPACARGVEVELSPRMFGCTATINPGDYTDALCRLGWRLCTDNDSAAKEPPAFYIANVRGLQVAPAPVNGAKFQVGWTHGTRYQETTRYIYGRGGGNYVEKPGVLAGGFEKVMQCQPGGVTYLSCGWNWGDERDTAQITTIGWLCCNF